MCSRAKPSTYSQSRLNFAARAWRCGRHESSPCVMNYQLCHELTFDVLYACIAILVFVILERSVYLSFLGWRMAKLGKIIDNSTNPSAKDFAAVRATDPASRAVLRYAQAMADGATRD